MMEKDLGSDFRDGLGIERGAFIHWRHRGKGNRGKLIFQGGSAGGSVVDGGRRLAEAGMEWNRGAGIFNHRDRIVFVRAASRTGMERPRCFKMDSYVKKKTPARKGPGVKNIFTVLENAR